MLKAGIATGVKCPMVCDQTLTDIPELMLVLLAIIVANVPFKELA